MNNDGPLTLPTFLPRLLLALGILAGTALTWGAVWLGLTTSPTRTCPRHSKVTLARLRIKAALHATAEYQLDNSSNCPRGIDELVSLKYLDPSNAKDPWGKNFTFHCPASCDSPPCADISSAGPDKEEGTPDDIKSWEL